MAKAIAAVVGAFEGKGRRGAAADYDVALMLSLKAGDEAAFQELVERNHAHVIRLVHRFVGNYNDVNDLAQEVFMRIYRARLSYKPTARFSTWMFRIAVNISLNARQSRATRCIGVSFDQICDEADGRSAVLDPQCRMPDDRMHQEELCDKVQEAIHALPDRQQIAVVLNKYEGMGYADIARTMGCGTAGVKSLLTRARNNLKDRLLLYLRTGRDPQGIA